VRASLPHLELLVSSLSAHAFKLGSCDQVATWQPHPIFVVQPSALRTRAMCCLRWTDKGCGGGGICTDGGTGGHGCGVCSSEGRGVRPPGSPADSSHMTWPSPYPPASANPNRASSEHRPPTRHSSREMEHAFTLASTRWSTEADFHNQHSFVDEG